MGDDAEVSDVVEVHGASIDSLRFHEMTSLAR
jgi:hypothetical protein